MANPELNSVDREQILARGQTFEEVESQLRYLNEGVPPLRLIRPCLLGDGVCIFSPAETVELARIFEIEQTLGRASKFVAASGAGSRMFEFLYPLVMKPEALDPRRSAGKAQETGYARDVTRFFRNLQLFPFYRELQSVISSGGGSCEELVAGGQFGLVAQYLLGAEGLGYAELPKGLIAFHNYPEGPRTALEEQVLEATGHVSDGSRNVRVHLTVMPGDTRRVNDHLQRRLEGYGSAYRFRVSVSEQDSSTDCIALDTAGRLLRHNDGSLVFRPGGHGALITNLDALQGDIVFIRTVDNVLPEERWAEVTLYKKALGGYLVTIQREVFRHLQELTTGETGESSIRNAEDFLSKVFSQSAHGQVSSLSLESRRQRLVSKLTRPVRVCGVVRHEGEPGGAPFWVLDREGQESLQLVEKAQVTMDSEDQRSIWESALYFNPVDIVCGMRDSQGRPFRLPSFLDDSARFVTIKTFRGRRIKTIEFPGLWNGGMAHWNTVFVEVPRTTFRPVKTVLDLIEPCAV